MVLLGLGDLAEIASLVARQQAVEIAGVITPTADVSRLTTDIAAIGGADAIVVTALVAPREAFEIALAALGPDRVYAPPLLRLQASGWANRTEGK